MTAVDLPAVPRVLIAEADPWSRDLLKQVLLNVRCDARLDVCADGQEAATLLRDVFTAFEGRNPGNTCAPIAARPPNWLGTPPSRYESGSPAWIW